MTDDRKTVAEIGLGAAHPVRITGTGISLSLVVERDLTDRGPNPASARAALARKLFADRRKRSDSFAGHDDLFGEAAWDILLDLYVQEATERAVTVGNLCAGSTSWWRAG